MVEVSYLWRANAQWQLFAMSQESIMKPTCTVTCSSAVPLTILLMCWVIIQLSWRPAVNPHTETVTLQLLLLAWTHCKGENNLCVSNVSDFLVLLLLYSDKDGHFHNCNLSQFVTTSLILLIAKLIVCDSVNMWLCMASFSASHSTSFTAVSHFFRWLQSMEAGCNQWRLQPSLVAASFHW